MTPTEQLQSSILELQEALISANPGMPTMLRTIHKNLAADPAIVTLLSEDEIAIIVSGLMKHTATVIATTTKKVSSKKLAGISLDDL